MELKATLFNNDEKQPLNGLNAEFTVVNKFVDEKNICEIITNEKGEATYRYKVYNPGYYTYHAEFKGDDIFKSSDSNNHCFFADFSWDWRWILYIPIFGSLIFLYLKEKLKMESLSIFTIVYFSLQFLFLAFGLKNYDLMSLLSFIGLWSISMFHGFILYRKYKKNEVSYGF